MATVAIRDQAGVVYEVPAELADRYTATGDYSPASDADVQVHQDRLTGAEAGMGERALAFGEGAARAGLALPALPAMGYELATGQPIQTTPMAVQQAIVEGLGGDRAAVAQRARALPTEAAAGQLTGDVALGLATGGLSSGLARGAAAGLTRAGMTEAGAALAGRAGVGALEGMVGGASGSAELAAEEGTPLTGEGLVAGALLGGLLGGGMPVAEAGVVAGARRAGRALQRGAQPILDSARLTLQETREAISRAFPSLSDEAVDVVARDAHASQAVGGRTAAQRLADVERSLTVEPGQIIGEDLAQGTGRGAALIREAAAEQTPLERILSESQSVASQADADVLGAVSPLAQIRGGRAREVARIAQHADSMLEELAGRLTRATQQVHELLSDVQEQVSRGGLKPANVLRNFEQLSDGQVADAARMLDSHASDLLEQASLGLGELADLGVSSQSAKRAYASIELYAQRAREALAEGVDRGTLARAYIDMDRARGEFWNRIGVLQRQATQQGGDEAAKAHLRAVVLPQLRERGEATRRMLADASVFGKQGSAQLRVNRQWPDVIDPGVSARNTLFREKPGAGQGGRAVDFETGRGIYEADPDKVRAFVEGLGSKGELSARDVRLWLDGVRRMTDAVRDGYDGLSDDVVSQLNKAVDEATSAMSEADKVAGVRNLVRDAERSQRQGLAGMGLTTTGAILGGAPGAALGAGAQSLASPIATAMATQRALTVARGVRERIRGAVRTLVMGEDMGAATRAIQRRASDAARTLRTGGQRLARAASAVGQAAARGAAMGRRAALRAGEVAAGRQAERERLRDQREAVRLASDPDRMEAVLEGAIAHAGPAGGAAASAVLGRAVAYLTQHTPGSVRSMQPHLSHPEDSVAPSELAAWQARWDAVSDPVGVLSRAGLDGLRPEHVEAIRAVYPSLYADLQGAAVEALSETREPIPYRRRVLLSTMLDIPGGDPTLDPAFGARLQQARLDAQQQQQQPRSGVQYSSGGHSDRMTAARAAGV